MLARSGSPGHPYHSHHERDGIELIIEAFAVVVIGARSMRGLWWGVGGGHPAGCGHLYYPELEMVLIYLIVIVIRVPAAGPVWGAWRMKVWITLGCVLLLVLAIPQLGWQY
jgi:hypothetical protein